LEFQAAEKTQATCEYSSNFAAVSYEVTRDHQIIFYFVGERSSTGVRGPVLQNRPLTTVVKRWILCFFRDLGPRTASSARRAFVCVTTADRLLTTLSTSQQSIRQNVTFMFRSIFSCWMHQPGSRRRRHMSPTVSRTCHKEIHQHSRMYQL